MATRADIILAATTRLGDEPPQSIDDDTDVMVAVDRIYPRIAATFLCKHGWSFATRITTLEATDDEPQEPWEYTFAKPADCTNIREVLNEYGAPVAYQLYEDRIYANDNETLTLIYTWSPSEERWPEDFAGAVEEELLGRLYEAFEEPTRGRETRAAARGLLREAWRRDMRQRPKGRVVAPRMLRAHYNRVTGRR